MAKIIIFYIDDQATHRDSIRISERLSNAQIKCQALPPPKLEHIGELTSHPPDLYLVDYDLAMQQPGGLVVAYKGSTLAAELRSRLPNIPIVLITRESIVEGLNPQVRRQLFNYFKVYDAFIYKSEVDEMLQATQEKLLSLAKGFKALSQIRNKSWKPLVDLIDADSAEAELMKEAIPPLEEGKWTTAQSADWIMNVLLSYPGILYDAVHAATLLGLSVKSFDHPKVQKFLESAKYKGIFASDDEKRWWKNRLLKLAKEFTITQKTDGSTNTAFRDAFSKKYRIKLESPTCVWDHQPNADWVCYILHQPVRVGNSLKYYPDNRPIIMDSARVSFRAVRECKEFDDRLLDLDGQRLVKKIEELSEL